MAVIVDSEATCYLKGAGGTKTESHHYADGVTSYELIFREGSLLQYWTHDLLFCNYHCCTLYCCHLYGAPRHYVVFNHLLFGVFVGRSALQGLGFCCFPHLPACTGSAAGGGGGFVLNNFAAFA